MNAASLINYLIQKNIISLTMKEKQNLCSKIGSDVILGIDQKNLVLAYKNKIKKIKKNLKIFTLLIKPNFGCSTKLIYKNVRNFSKSSLNNKFIKNISLKKIKLLKNDLEKVAKSKYPKIEKLLNFMKNLKDNEFVRMTGSGSCFVEYFKYNKDSISTLKKFKKKYPNYWSVLSKTV